MGARNVLKSLASRLPIRLQNDLRRHRFARQIRSGRFVTDEAEFAMLESWVRPGDCVIDIGANIGHYPCRLSELVGTEGRVFSVEPIPETLEVLSSNVSRLGARNVTILNVAASDTAGIVGMSIPKFETGLDNFYMAQVSDETAELSVAAIRIDSLEIRRPVTFVKIDAEGHELSVLRGMRGLIEEHRPVLVIEDNAPELREFLAQLGYGSRAIEGSSNRIFEVEAAPGGTSG